MSPITKISHGGHTEVAEYGGVLYLGGVAASDTTQSLEGQMRQVLTEIDRILERAGSSKQRIIQAKVNLTDFTYKEPMNAIWQEWLDGIELPARSTNAVVSLGEGVLVEVVIIAAKELLQKIRSYKSTYSQISAPRRDSVLGQLCQRDLHL